MEVETTKIVIQCALWIIGVFGFGLITFGAYYALSEGDTLNSIAFSVVFTVIMLAVALAFLYHNNTNQEISNDTIRQEVIEPQIVEHQIVEHQIVENQVDASKQEKVPETEDKEVTCSKGSYCTECGAKLPENAKFCGECGTSVK